MSIYFLVALPTKAFRLNFYHLSVPGSGWASKSPGGHVIGLHPQHLPLHFLRLSKGGDGFLELDWWGRTNVAPSHVDAIALFAIEEQSADNLFRED